MVTKSLAWVTLLFSLSAKAGPLSLSGVPQVAFHASGPAGFRIEGSSSVLFVEEGAETLTFTAPLDKVSTGIALRDKHLREIYLETDKYPNAVLVLSREALKWPSQGANLEAVVPATLRLHGQTKPITVRYRATQKDKTFSVQASFQVDMRDYGIQTPRYLGVTVKPLVEVSASLLLTNT